MDNRPTVMLTGNDLSIEDIVAIGIGDKQVAIAPDALVRCRASRGFLEEEIRAKRIIYGVNTSFGPMCNKIINDNEIEELQVNLIKSHAAGLGDPIKPYITLAILAVRLNTLAKGYSGVRVELLDFMKNMINAGIAPYVPECGSVGASGDLVHLAHVALAIIGEGKVYYKQRLHETRDAFLEADLRPFTLGFKEGIAIINGTSAMTALAAFALFGARKLLRLACVNAAFAIEIFGGIDDAFDEDLHRLKPHPGQLAVSEIIRNLYHGSGNITLRKNMHDIIRSSSSRRARVRNLDQRARRVFHPVRAADPCAYMGSAGIRRSTIYIETNSSNDNPVIVPGVKKIIHGGNFHGQSIAFSMDMLCIAIAQLCTLSERRLNKLLDKNLNEGLPEHLIAGTVGLTMGFMGAQYLATSTTAENRQLANPVSTLSISCNASNQDVVSMGTVAARKAFKSVSNAKHVLTLETLAQLQALSFRNADRLGKGTKRIYDILKKHFAVYDNKRVFHEDLVKFRKLLFSSQIFDDLDQYMK